MRERRKMKMSAATSYALHSLALLARWDQRVPVSARRLAAGDLPKRFLPQVLHKLVDCGVLISRAGVTGGYCLARSPADITLLEILEAVDGKFCITLANLPSLPKQSQQGLDAKLQAASECVRERLRAITLADLVCAESDQNDVLCRTKSNGCKTRISIDRSNQIA
jgi:Rrf2 family protein